MILVFLAEGFEETEAIVPIDILKRAGIDVLTVGTDNKFIKGAHGINIEADIKISELNVSDVDGVILPGGMPGVLNLEKCEKVKEYTKDCFNNGKMVAAICAAPSLLGKWGILEGKEATVYPGFEEYLLGASLSSQNVVKSENVITANAAGSAFGFAFEVLSYLKGEKSKDEIKRTIISI